MRKASLLALLVISAALPLHGAIPEGQRNALQALCVATGRVPSRQGAAPMRDLRFGSGDGLTASATLDPGLTTPAEAAAITAYRQRGLHQDCRAIPPD